MPMKNPPHPGDLGENGTWYPFSVRTLRGSGRLFVA